MLAGCDPNGDDPATPKPPKLVEPNEDAGVDNPALSPDAGFGADSVEGAEEPNAPPLPNTLPPVPNADFPALPNADDVPNGEAEFEVLKVDLPATPPNADAPPVPNAEPPVLNVDDPNVGGAVSSFFACSALDPNEKPTGFPIDPDDGAVKAPKPPNVGAVLVLPNGLAPKADLGASFEALACSSAGLSVFVDGAEKPPNEVPEPNPELEDPKELVPNPKPEALKGEGFDVSEARPTSTLASLGSPTFALKADDSGLEAPVGLPKNGVEGGIALALSDSLASIVESCTAEREAEIVLAVGGVNFGKEGGSNLGNDGAPELPRGVNEGADGFSAGVDVPDPEGEVKGFPPNENPPEGGGGARDGLVLAASNVAWISLR